MLILDFIIHAIFIPYSVLASLDQGYSSPGLPSNSSGVDSWGSNNEEQHFQNGTTLAKKYVQCCFL